MNGGSAMLYVATGLHRGAGIALRNGERLSLGSADDNDVRLLDPGIGSHHARLLAGRWFVRLEALDTAVGHRGRILQPGQSRRLLGRWQLELAEVEVRYIPAGRRSLGARLAGLFQPRSVPAQLRAPLVAAMMFLATWGVLQGGLWLNDTASRPAPVTLADPRFAHVKVIKDPATQVDTFVGVVSDQTALVALGRLARRTRARVDVHVDGQLLAQVQDFASHYYRGAVVRRRGPGHYLLEHAGPASFVDALAWDPVALARDARAAVPGLAKLDIQTDTGLLGAYVAVPLETLPLTLVNTRSGSYLSGRNHQKFFEGAALANGRITELGRCQASFVDTQQLRLLLYTPGGRIDAPCSF